MTTVDRMRYTKAYRHIGVVCHARTCAVIRPNPRSKSTATKENALSDAERDTLLAMRQDAREGRAIVTIRPDSWLTWDYNKD